MERKNFIRNEEDFVCENCGLEVRGTGYTNHCPECLFSKHVDNVPGDRSNPCGGLMAPLGLKSKNGEYQILHKCIKCGHEQPNKTAPEDNRDLLLTLPVLS